ncbi:MAG TPA: STAS domain-containing protein [Streptosporangiaceae bacterium]|jgi:anti-sigma B factor antagonist|nr:STAS domain-containing protein [Streptosporangiaceae bacterium]
MTTECVPEQEFRVWSLGGLPIVTPPLEVDVGNAESFGAALAAASRGNVTVVVDMTATEFCDSSGLSALAAALCRAQAAGGELRLVVGSPVVRKVLAVTGMDSVCVMFDQLPEAIAARVSQPGSGV